MDDHRHAPVRPRQLARPRRPPRRPPPGAAAAARRPARGAVMTQRFDTPNPILVDVRVPAGDVDLDAADTTETEVTVEPRNDPARDRLDQVVVSLEGDRLRIEVPDNRFSFGHSPEYAVTVRCPTGSRVRLKTASADLTARGTVGGVDVKAASGDVSVDDVDGELRVDAASSDIRAASVSGDTSVRS